MFLTYHKGDMEVFHYSFFQDAPSEEVKAKLNIKHWRNNQQEFRFGTTAP